MHICIISGARPQFIKLAPVIKAFSKITDCQISHIHTGQHYDKEMSEQIFQDLDLQTPDFNLEVGSGSHGKQTGKMLKSIEEKLFELQPDIVLVPGDTNSTISGALAAVKLQIPVIHLEAGLRSYDWHMPEEINRMVVDRISSLLITTTPIATENLIGENFDSARIFETGDTMVDALFNAKNKIMGDSPIINDEYFLATVHRQENVDDITQLNKLYDIFSNSPLKIVLPIHPRTKSNLEKYGLLERFEKLENLIILKPQGYLDFANLQLHSKGILTDSGGIQKEAFILKKPCITLRTTTEWVETLKSGANYITGLNVDKVCKLMNQVVNGEFIVTANHPYGDGKSGEMIATEIKARYTQGLISFGNNMR